MKKVPLKYIMNPEDRKSSSDYPNDNSSSTSEKKQNRISGEFVQRKVESTVESKVQQKNSNYVCVVVKRTKWTQSSSLRLIR